MSCERRPDGLFVTTTCLYPSFEQVGVYIVGHGDGYMIHDNADGARLAWMYGVDERAFTQLAAQSALYYGCDSSGLQIYCKIDSEDWLWSAISTVANASADAAKTAVGKARMAKEVPLVTRAKAVFDRAQWRPETRLNHRFRGVSGKMYTFDLAVIKGGNTALIDTVTPHRNSIDARYRAFSDTPLRPGIYKYALHEERAAFRG